MKFKVGDKVRFMEDCALDNSVIHAESVWEVSDISKEHYTLVCVEKNNLLAVVDCESVDNSSERINTEPSLTKRINNKHDILNGLFNSDGSVDGEKLMKKLESQNDSVNHPSHYTDGNIEVIDFIEDKKLGYHLGNACKYICRAGKKDPAKRVEDLRKAIWYVNRQAEIWEREQE